MQGGTGLIDILIIVLILAFVVTRFMSHDLPKETKKKRTTASKKSTVVSFPNEGIKPVKTRKKSPNLDNLSGMEQVKAMDNAFKERDFLEGAKQGYTMFYSALNDIDEETLDDLTAPRLFDRYMDKVESLENKGHKQIVEIQSIEDASVVEAKVSGQTAIIDVKYIAKHVEYIVDGEDNIVSGDKKTVKDVTTVWTWARNVNSTDPNWELEEVSALA